MKVSEYDLRASSGRHIRKATMVTMANGRVIKFMEKMSKKEAIRNATYQISKETEIDDESLKDAAPSMHQALKAIASMHVDDETSHREVLAICMAVARTEIEKLVKTEEPEEFLGYTVEKTGNDRTPYILHGPRDANYGLVRNTNKPEFMFAINLNRYSKVVAVKGNSWFTDRNGHLEVAYVL